jgi:hypothetical protein
VNAAVRDAIERADAAGLRALLAADPDLAEAPVVWGEGGKNSVPPLHFVCDAVFRQLATEEQALELADALLGAGADPRRAYAESGDTFLIAAASLGAERVGLRLVEVGVDVTARGLFGATALHWAAIMGLGGLARALLEAGAELDLRDERYQCTPLEWALHGWTEGTSGRRDGLPGVVRELRERGARVPAAAASVLASDADAGMRAALEAGGPN